MAYHAAVAGVINSKHCEIIIVERIIVNIGFQYQLVDIVSPSLKTEYMYMYIAVLSSLGTVTDKPQES